ncbi:MAG: deaminase domain-containing protein, partial [Rhabdochlamydiaceae bacterium]
DHTYVVGMAHWIVHNDSACGGDGDGPSRVQDLRQANQVGNGRNIATMDYNIGGESDSVWSSSGPDFKGSIPKPTDPYFDATPTGNNLRNADSEYKLLNWLAQRFNPAGVPTSDVSGTVDLYTERPPCESCAGVIDQFRNMFRNIILNVADGSE